MKITNEQLNYLVTAMRPAVELIPPYADYVARKPNVANAQNIKDPAKRYRWDLLNAASIYPFISTHLYGTGCNDEHIDTALKAVIKTLEV